jgi:hypothetical protein
MYVALRGAMCKREVRGTPTNYAVRIQIKENVKAGLTLSSTGASGSEGPRTHVQGT